ncbi:hypothetical protein SARC_04298 [Sphaeroforma arctica JP610]|uniref:Uncharacterized protein n=1 Tax=Sphaeroforma arctica JP610 TaxID=667725 RepID=A0A0L0G2U7_9EUKA|nr:hypothetical protein SARC_04298 [Sphaeroforma arctica JP610]KNC83457.1 hypothetical protein SARC_04298 [Sphaeroforma arctica JP610]|eukprot:XP_014157359.1 hypothetical protein SARC_04298 [Sphaeroforma arctica JP610]
MCLVLFATVAAAFPSNVDTLVKHYGEMYLKDGIVPQVAKTHAFMKEGKVHMHVDLLGITHEFLLEPTSVFSQDLIISIVKGGGVVENLAPPKQYSYHVVDERNADVSGTAIVHDNGFNKDRIDILWETMFSTERSSASANRRTSSETDTDETTDAHNNPHTHSGERVGQTEHKPTPSGQVPNFPSIVSSSPAVIPCVRASRHTHTYRDKDTNVLPSRHAYKSTPTHTQTDTGTPKSEQACTYTQRNIHLHRYSGDDGVRHTPDNNMGVYDNTTGPYDNQTSAYDNQTSAYDNQACAYNNQTSAYDNQTRAPGERDVDRGSELFYSVRGLDNACSEVLESVALETVTINDTLRVQSVVLDMDPSLPLRRAKVKDECQKCRKLS